MKDMTLIFNDRQFENGWADSYQVKIYFGEEVFDAYEVREALQRSADRILDILSCSKEGIGQIIAAYNDECHERLQIIKYEIEYVPTVCFGAGPFNLD